MEKDTVMDPLPQVLKFVVGPRGWRPQKNFSVTKKTKKDHDLHQPNTAEWDLVKAKP